MVCSSASPSHVLTAIVLVASCAASCVEAPTPRGGTRAEASSERGPAASPPAAEGAPHHLTPLDGHAFPDRVLALTWDDGPDENTLDLAAFLAREKVFGTFFVVSEWIEGVSAEPGRGHDVLATGHRYIPVLADVVALGHRLGNHTAHHALLSELHAAGVARELAQNQHDIDPLLTGGLALFRAPGGAWNRAAASAVDADEHLDGLLGPVGWDIDRKDWECSLFCRSDRPATECEPAAPGGALRVRPQVVARRYLESAIAAGRGIVLLHDRVGHVGSRYALDVAQALVPALKARGFVFAAPVLAFGRPALRAAEAARWEGLTTGDLDGDGRVDACGWTARGLSCTLSDTRTTTPERAPRPVEHAFDVAVSIPSGAGPSSEGWFYLADVDGDRQADVCIPHGSGVACAVTRPDARLGRLAPWSRPHRRGGRRALADGGTTCTEEPARELLGLADVDGDGRADACTRASEGILCAPSLGTEFDEARLWLSLPDDPVAQGRATTTALADVDGDGRADLCRATRTGIACALSDGRRFGPLRAWSTDRLGTEIRFGDLNGDGRADVCGLEHGTIACALSTGSGFTKGTAWLPAAGTSAFDDEHGTSFRLADVSGDGRADACGLGAEGLVCALAP